MSRRFRRCAGAIACGIVFLARPTVAQENPRLFYEVDGAGPLVVLVSDWAQDTSSWFRILPRLRREFHVARYDPRGQGRSDAAPNGDYGLDRHRDDLGRLLDGLGAPDAHLVGSGLGARVVVAFAQANPERVRSLVVVNPNFAWTGEDLAWWNRFLDAYDQVGEPSLGEYATVFVQRWFGSSFPTRERWIEPFHDLMLRRQAPEPLITSMRWWLSTDLAIDSTPSRIPILVIRSDRAGTPLAEPRLRQAFPRMRHFRVQQSARYPQLDAATIFGDQLAGFIAEIEREERGAR